MTRVLLITCSLLASCVHHEPLCPDKQQPWVLINGSVYCENIKNYGRNADMLILTLSRGRQIDITLEDGRRIEIMGLEGDHTHFRLGFTAPKTILIDRHVVTVRKAQESPDGE